MIEAWSPSNEAANKAKWAKNAVKAQNGFRTPNFNKRINDIRSNSVRSLASIKNDILILEEDLYNVEKSLSREFIEVHTIKVKSAYIASMIIRHVESVGFCKYLASISDALGQLESIDKNENGLLSLHSEICELLLRGDLIFNTWQSSYGLSLIKRLDNYLLPVIEPTHPAIQDIMKDHMGCSVWPSLNDIESRLNDYKMCSLICGHEESTLESALIDYYEMYVFTDNGEYNEAFECCLEVENYSEKIHMGSFLAANLIHKIVLYWHLNGTMKHNQFSTEITQIAIHVPDQSAFEVLMNPVFSDFINSLSDEERMMFYVFKIFNLKHPKAIADPFNLLVSAAVLAQKICAGNTMEIEDLLPKFRKEIDQKYKRTLSVLPFKHVTLSQGIDMLLELHHFVGIPLSHYDDIYRINMDKRCALLIKAYDKELS